MLKVKSTFEATAIVPADSQGPYVVDAGSPVVLSASAIHPEASYEWDLGDGTIANTPTVTHAYPDNGLYIVKLKIVVNQPGGATSRHFAFVNVRNVPPVADAGPDRIVYEGDVVQFTGTFTDVEYPDSHEATWDWGDYQKPDAGIVSETNTPPKAQGTVTGGHAWGDNGNYTVTLTVRDEDGGVGRDTLALTVRNVPPIVDAGPDMYTYPCTVLTLTARFTDPGWLDTHVGTWDFGDCTPPMPAVIREKNEPPRGTGLAIASHVYERCGTYPAVCTVIDDDGSVGTDTAIIRVVDIRNKGFEDGFRERAAGAVANGWEPYRSEIPVFGAKPPAELDVAGGPAAFLAEEYRVHGGQRSQRIRFEGDTRFGIRQQVGANAGWDYQIKAWYSLAEESSGVARLGLDSTGGTNPSASTVVWVDGRERTEWRQLLVRSTASKAGEITVFLEGQGELRKTCEVYFDDVALIAVQPFCFDQKEPHGPEPGPEPTPTPTCVEFSDLQPHIQLPPIFERWKFTFEAVDKRPLHIATWGLPPGRSKLHVRAGLVVHLPFPAAWIGVKIFEPSSSSLVAVARNAQGAVVATAGSVPSNDVQTIKLTASGITYVEVKGGSGEAVLIEVCARPDQDTQEAV